MSLTECKRAYNSLSFHEGVAVWTFEELMEAFALAAIKSHLNLSLIDANMHKGTNTTYAEMVSHLLTKYAADAFIGKTDEDICNSWQGKLRPGDFS